VLGSVVVAERHRLLSGLDLDDDTLLDRLPRDLASRKSPRLGVDSLLDSGKLGRSDVNGEEDYLGIDSVLGLGEKVRGDKGRVRAGVGDDLRTREDRFTRRISQSDAREKADFEEKRASLNVREPQMAQQAYRSQRGR
jgi:hypothetical protein